MLGRTAAGCPSSSLRVRVPPATLSHTNGHVECVGDLGQPSKADTGEVPAPLRRPERDLDVTRRLIQAYLRWLGLDR